MIPARRRSLITFASVLVWTLGCRQEVEESSNPPAPAPEVEQAPEPVLALESGEPRLPPIAGTFGPAMTELGEGPEPTTGRELLDADTCGNCHEEVVTQWRTSAHAFASFDNPIYRASIDRFREGEGGEARSRFCGGCHDPALLVDGAMNTAVSAEDGRAHVGVACRSCHGVESSTPDGNGSYVLASTPIPLPDMRDEASIQRHRAAMGPAREACGSCHRAFIGVASGHPHHLAGTDELGPWRDSSYSGSKLRLDTPVEERDCADCHMPRQGVEAGASDPAIAEDGTLRSHRFIGGHSYLAAMRGDGETLARVQDFLRGIASVDIAAVEPAGERNLLGRGVRLAPSSKPDAKPRPRKLQVDLVVRNLAVGHRFPGGTRDAQHSWLSLRVLDAEGRVIAELDEDSGEVHRLRTGVVNEEGELVLAREVEELRAVAFDHTIGPRDAVVVRYAVELPGKLASDALRVEARLLHRSRTLELAEETCRASKTPRGRAFVAAAAEILGQRLDPCVELPVTEIAAHTLVLGPATDPPSASERPDHERLWELGMALYHQVQERLPEAREALDAALNTLAHADLEPKDKAAAKARILAALGAVAARQGRVDEALELADRVADLHPGHPYPHLLRGRALAKVWRWEEAVPHLERAFAVSPESPKLAGELATALGSAGLAERALAVAITGLKLRPRDPTLLRAQALALRALDDPRTQAALDAYLEHRVPDVQPHLAADCGERDPSCARERVPVHVHE